MQSRIAPRLTKVEKDPINGYRLQYNRHPLRKNNLKVAEMYDCYIDGMSLQTIAKLYETTRQSVYDVFRSRGYKLRTKKKKGLMIKFGISFTLDGHGTLRGSKDGKRVYLHRMVWEEKNGPIPAKHVLLFKDGDRRNIDISNLELLPMAMMSRRFNPESHNQFTKKVHKK